MIKRIAFAVISLFILALPLALASNPGATIAEEASGISLDLGNSIVSNTQTNLLPNPSFENGTTLPDGWNGSSETWDASIAHTGTRSVCVEPSGGYWKLSDPIYLWEGQQYYFAFWHRETSEPNYVGIWIAQEGGPYLNLVDWAYGDGQWHYYETSFEYSGWTYVWLVGATDNGGVPTFTGKVWYDDVYLGTEPPQPSIITDEGILRYAEVSFCYESYYLEYCDGTEGHWLRSDTIDLSAYVGQYVRVTGPRADNPECEVINVTSIEILPNPCVPPSVDIWVDKGKGATYCVGDSITICYSVSRPIYIRIWAITSQGSWVITEGYDDGTGDCFYGTIGLPTGKHTYRIEAIEGGNVVSSDDTWVWVNECVTPIQFYLPISYPGRTKGTSEGFNTTFNSKVTAAFDHTLPGQGKSGQHRPFTGKTYTAADCPTGKFGIMCYDGHNGTDFDDRPGDQRAFAVAAGTVIYVGDKYDGYGNRVEIRHGDTGYTTIYCHLAKWLVSVGQQVDHTTQVGIIGDTGWGCPEGATHLHLTVKYHGTVVDPTGWWHRTEPDPWEVQSGVASRYLWAYPINASESINPAVGGALTSPSGQITITAPAGVYGETIDLVFTDVPVAAPSAELYSTGHSFSLEAFDSRGDPVTTLDKPLAITIHYGDIAKVREDTLALHSWDDGTSAWQPIATTIDLANNIAYAQVTHLSEFALFGERSYQIYLPFILKNSSSGPQPTAMQIAPTTSSVHRDQTFDVEVRIENAADLGGYEFSMDFDPDVVQVLDVEDASFLGSTGRTVFTAGPHIDNGTLTFGAFSLGDQPGPDRDGTLATITLKAVGIGDSPLALHDAIVLNLTADEWKTLDLVEDGTVTVYP